MKDGCTTDLCKKVYKDKFNSTEINFITSLKYALSSEQNKENGTELTLKEYLNYLEQTHPKGVKF